VAQVRAFNERRLAATQPLVYFGVTSNGGKVYRANLLVDGQEELLFDYSAEFERCYLGPWEGNFDRFDRRAALMCYESASKDEVTVVVIDVTTKTEVSRRAFAGEGFSGNLDDIVDWASITQSGEYVVIMWRPGAAIQGFSTRSYRADDMSTVAKLSSDTQHADLCIDSAGDDVVQRVGDLRSVRVRDGLFVNQVNLATAAGISGHVSCRNYQRPGWAYLTGGSFGWYSIWSFPLNGSKLIEDWGEHRSGGHSAMGVPSPRGDKVLFASNWFNTNNRIYAYVFDSEEPSPPGSVGAPVTTTGSPATTAPSPGTSAPGSTPAPFVGLPALQVSVVDEGTWTQAPVATTFHDFRAERLPTEEVTVQLAVDASGALWLRFTVTDDAIVAPATDASGDTWYQDDLVELFVAMDDETAAANGLHVLASATGLLTEIPEVAGVAATSTLTSDGYTVTVSLSASLASTTTGWTGARLLLTAVDRDDAGPNPGYRYFDAEGFAEDGPYSFDTSPTWPAVSLVTSESLTSTGAVDGTTASTGPGGSSASPGATDANEDLVAAGTSSSSDDSTVPSTAVTVIIVLAVLVVLVLCVSAVMLARSRRQNVALVADRSSTQLSKRASRQVRQSRRQSMHKPQWA